MAWLLTASSLSTVAGHKWVVRGSLMARLRKGTRRDSLVLPEPSVPRASRLRRIPDGFLVRSGLDPSPVPDPKTGLLPAETSLWAHEDLNLGPLPCQGSALPLSYAPGLSARGRWRV